MTQLNYDYWPFTDTTADGRAEADQIAFLKAAHDQGCESFRFGLNDYGARLREREGCIIERGRHRWEIRLALREQRRLLAFVDNFTKAGEAVRQWLDGTCPREIVNHIAHCLVTPPGAKASHVIIEEDRRD